jgi:hypothetical protein
MQRKLSASIMALGLTVGSVALASPASASVTNTSCGLLWGTTARIDAWNDGHYCYLGTGSGWASVENCKDVYSGVYYAKWEMGDEYGNPYWVHLSPFQTSDGIGAFGLFSCDSFVLSNTPV